MTTVTRGNWSVSTETGSKMQGTVLNVFKHHTINGRWVMQPGDANGKKFPTKEEAFAYALDHGYLQEHVRRVWCPGCRVLHTFMGKGSSFCPVQSKFIGT